MNSKLTDVRQATKLEYGYIVTNKNSFTVDSLIVLLNDTSNLDEIIYYPSLQSIVGDKDINNISESDYYRIELPIGTKIYSNRLNSRHHIYSSDIISINKVVKINLFDEQTKILIDTYIKLNDLYFNGNAILTGSTNLAYKNEISHRVPHDIDIVIPYYIALPTNLTVTEFDESHAYSNVAYQFYNNDNIKVDIFINPNEKYKVVKHNGTDIKLAYSTNILKAKFNYIGTKYTLNTISEYNKHIEDIMKIMEHNFDIG